MSRAEIDGVKLEIEQPLHENAIEIRVRDHSATNRQLEELGCDVLYVNESGRENKVGRAVLRRSGSSDTYIGTYATDKGFAHGAIAKVVYKIDSLGPTTGYMDHALLPLRLRLIDVIRRSGKRR